MEKIFKKRIKEEEIENMNRQITSNGIEDVINNAPMTKSPQPDGFRVGIYQTFREELTRILKWFFSFIIQKETLPSSFYKAIITLRLQEDKYVTKEKIMAKITDMQDAIMSQQYTSK